MDVNISSEQIYYGTVTRFDAVKHYGFIEDEQGNSLYFWVDTKEIRQKNRELRKQKNTNLYKTIYFAGDEVKFKIKSENDKVEAYDIEYICNIDRQYLIKEFAENNILYGYLKQIDNQFFVKHISTYIFIPVKISNYEIDIDMVYTQRLNKLVPFTLKDTTKIEKLSAVLVDVKFSDNWNKIKVASDTQQIVEGFIKEKSKCGFVVDIFGIDTFLPSSQIDVKPTDDYSVFVGKTMEFKVIKLDDEHKNVVVSHKIIIESQLEIQKQEILSQLEIGQILEGVVKNITNYGVFIDLGGIDGLIHISDLSQNKVVPNDILTIGEKIKVIILSIDNQKKRIALGLKQLNKSL